MPIRTFLITLTATVLLLLGGCSTPVEPPGEASGEQQTAPTGAGGRVVTLPTPRQRLVFTARQEWALWGRGVWDAATDTYEWPAATAPGREHVPDFSSRVLLYWQALDNGAGLQAEEAQYGDGSLIPWSAVFISFLVKAAGIGAERFPGSALHWHYIKHIHDAPDPQGFEALDAATTPPAVGDLICAPRDATALRVWSFAQLADPDSRGGYHCDVVVEIGNGTLGAIGGNVRDAVTWTRVRLREGGLLEPSPQRPWIVVLRNHLP
ncbi:DUF2272 domain-containing protein [Azohydromonas caseinilytica]|uniref:DUF2272 domain-containing protein n=1 Tax=Azohydromonas caseinilytica TaxID=2728836 RepID=A0A848F624_9BURK|nr:DUF2272 domain-containing protein [Azohydromonas caseinilytica]NML14842.1 DUF2272 domain-containing protein [Azohydromonas caseinilytica]